MEKQIFIFPGHKQCWIGKITFTLLLYLQLHIFCSTLSFWQSLLLFSFRSTKFYEHTNHNKHRKRRSHRDERVFYIVKTDSNSRRRRSIADAVIESARCEHIELVDCEAYDSDEMTCMITATGMPCCICNGKLKSLKTGRKHWSLW